MSFVKFPVTLQEDGARVPSGICEAGEIVYSDRMSLERTGTPSAGQGGEAGRLLIIDGHAYAYRAFYAIRELMAPDGFPTNAIYGFIKMLAKIHSWLRPTHQVVIWDGGLASERMAALPEYKATRKPMPSDLEKQLDGIAEYLRGAN